MKNVADNPNSSMLAGSMDISSRWDMALGMLASGMARLKMVMSGVPIECPESGVSAQDASRIHVSEVVFCRNQK